MIDTKKIMADWAEQSAYIKKPKLSDACSVIESLCAEISSLRREVNDLKCLESSYDRKLEQLSSEIDVFIRARMTSLKIKSTGS